MGLSGKSTSPFTMVAGNVVADVLFFYFDRDDKKKHTQFYITEHSKRISVGCWATHNYFGAPRILQFHIVYRKILYLLYNVTGLWRPWFTQNKVLPESRLSALEG